MRPGTHHVRFWVDDHWRVADDLPAAVDDQGSLSNYVAVPLTYGIPGTPQPFNIIQVPPPPSVQRKPASGPSFWSADSSADGDNDDPPLRPTTTAAGKSKGKAVDSKHPTAASAAVAAYQAAKWTNVYPPELTVAADEEEAYLAASAGQYDLPTGNTRVTGFVPAPNIPPAPGLPRHLEKLILNTRVGPQKSEGSGHGSNGNAAGGAAGGSGSSAIGSGQGSSSARRERRERERAERERERGPRSSRRGNVPPPPPPSEDGTGDYEPPYIPTQPIPATTPSGHTYSRSLPGSGSPASGSGSGPAIASSSGGTISAGSGGVDSAGTTTAATSPQGSLPATPTGPLSPTQTPPKISWTSGTGPVPSAVLAATMSPGILLAQAQAQQSQAQAAQTAQTITTLQPYSPDRAPISGSRTITLDDGDMPVLTDDNSVLPVPSHVVLHHLCTSAIRNGVLAVGTTTRYKKKVRSCFLACFFFGLMSGN